MRKIEKYSRFFIIIGWVASTLIYLYLFGIFKDLEAEKYINEAHYLIKNCAFSSPRYWFYAITVFILTVAFVLKIGIKGAFAMQALLNLFAFLYFHKALKKLFESEATPLFMVLLLLFFWPYQSWIVYMYTESVFFSLILMLLSVMILHKPDNLRNIIYIGTSLILVMLSRPLGILFVAGVFAFIFYSANKKWRIILFLSAVVFIGIGIFIINTIFSTIDDWYITKPFEQESIICNLPNNSISGTKLDLLSTSNPLLQLEYYISHNFSHFRHFAFLKLKYFFLMTRPYYSKAHNYFLLINCTFVYTLAFFGIFRKSFFSNKGINLFILTSILFYSMAIVLQCDDYHNRFILSIFPLFVIMAGKPIDQLLLHFIAKATPLSKKQS